MTERDKIIEVIDEWANKAVKANKFDGASVYNPHNAAELADKLIEAGIGDTTNLIVENEVLQRDIDNLMRTLEEGSEEFQEAEHRAQVAERALRNITERASCNICDNFSCRYFEGINFDYNAEDCIKWWLAQAEKELEEEKSNGEKKKV